MRGVCLILSLLIVATGCSDSSSSGGREIGWAIDLPLVGAPECKPPNGSISNWSAPGFIRAGIMNVSDSAFSVSITVRGYRDTRPYQFKNFTSVVANGQTFEARLEQSTSFNDRAVAIFTSPPQRRFVHNTTYRR